MENALLATTNEIATALFKDDTLDNFLKKVESDALNFVGTTKTTKGRDAIKSKAASIAKIKTALDDAGKKLIEKEAAFIKCVNVDRKKARDFLDDLKMKVRKPVTDFEIADKERIEKERLAAEYEIGWEDALKEDELWELRKEKELREEEERKKKDERKAKEKSEIEKKERIEREKRIAQEVEERVKREAQEKIEAEKRARIIAEEKEKAEKGRAEREKREAVEKARRDEVARIAQETARIAQEEKIKKEKEERAARNKNHQKKINREIYFDFLDNKISEEVAKNVVLLLVGNKIKHITINY